MLAINTSQGISLSINPTYLCNFRCPFCYLSKEQLSNKTVVNSDVLFERLTEVASVKTIEHIDLYGGEISLLSEQDFEKIINTIKVFYSGKINIITNLFKTPQFIFREDVDLSVSWDFNARERHEAVYQNMLNIKKPIHVLMLATEKLLRLDIGGVGKIIEMLNGVFAIETLEIKPYSQSKYNLSVCRHSEYEDFVQKWIDSSDQMKFKFINIEKIKACHGGGYSSWSDNHLYIQPSGDLAVLDFDDDNKEYFKPVASMYEYEAWCAEEKSKISENKFCGSCKYLGSCLSEHLQVVKSRTHSCNGFYNLLERNLK